MAYSKTAVSVIQGMSTQADKYMVDGQCRYQKNMIPSPADGICKRPSTELISQLDFLDQNLDYKFFAVEISGDNYIFALVPSRVYIIKNFELVKTIDILGNDQKYLEGNLEDLEMYYIDDSVYILNKGVTVKIIEEDAITHATTCAIWGTGVAQYKEYTATVSVHRVVDDEVVFVTSSSYEVTTPENTKTTTVISNIYAGIDTTGPDLTDPQGDVQWFEKSSGSEVIACKLMPDLQKDYYIKVVTDDDASNTYLKSYSDVVNSSQSLPRLALQGMRATVSVAENNIDDWFLQFEAKTESVPFVGENITIEVAYDGRKKELYLDTDTETTFRMGLSGQRSVQTTVTGIISNFYDFFLPDGSPLQVGSSINVGSWDGTTITAKRKDAANVPVEGVWKESAKPGSNNFDRLTIPLVLTKELKEFPENPTDFEWTLGPLDWLPRRVGDEESAPFPKFVGSTINSMYEHAGRLVVVTDDYIDLGVVAEPNNWFRFTATDILITDPFPVSYGNKKGTLKYPVTLNGDLYIFGDRDQLRLSGAPLGPTNYSLTGVSSYPSADVEPLVTGNMIHFISKSDRYNSVYSFAGVYNSGSNIVTAESISEQISRHIQGTVTQTISDYNLSSMLVATDVDPKKLHLYNFYFVDNTIRQSAWSDLEFSFDVVHIFVSNSVYYFVAKFENNYHVYKWDIKDLIRPDNIYLDNKQEITFVNGVATPPYVSDDFKLYDWTVRPGTELPYTNNGDGTITCPLLLNEPTYTCQWGATFESILVPRLVTEATQMGTVNHTAKYMLASLGLDLGLSGQFNVKIQGNGADYDNNYNQSALPKPQVGYINSHSYTEELSVRALADMNLWITISANNSEPLCIQGLYYLYNRKQRRTAL